MKSDKIITREVTPEDVAELQAIGRQTFSETFSSGNTEKNMKKYLEEGFSKEPEGDQLLQKERVC